MRASFILPGSMPRSATVTGAARRLLGSAVQTPKIALRREQTHEKT
jgi:hypothetical protein